MNKQNKMDVLVVGMGIAGLMAAYTAAKRGKDVTLLGSGLGSLSIASGCIDVLGYVGDSSSQGMQRVHKPFDAFEQLSINHPYSIIGKNSVEQALISIYDLCKMHSEQTKKGFEFEVNGQNNTLVPTLMGTLKPTYIYPIASDSAPLFLAKRVVVTSVDAIRDCHPQLIANQLQKYPKLKHIEFNTKLLSSRFGKTHRAVSPLDIARYVDTEQGLEWLCNALKPLENDADTILIPPILGTKDATAWQKLKHKLSCSVVEMISLPPGVGGNRLFSLIMQAIRATGKVRVIENATISHAEVQNGHCKALISQGEGVEHRYEAASYIIATGGILSGGVITKPGKAYESIFGIEIKMPENQEEWAAESAFSAHAFSRMGVGVNKKLQALDANMNVLLENVFFAGRTIGGYDFATEKSGNGVALATAWHAAQQV